jgi:hypothetical protein
MNWHYFADIVIDIGLGVAMVLFLVCVFWEAPND